CPKTIFMLTIKNTKVGNSKYQSLVLEIPTVGTRNTKEWYLEYQPLVLNIPKSGIQMEHVVYCFITCYK
ncbi:MAG: hypothetical protein KBA45_05470, partial [Bacteroides sp.]|nr:hypothetical protein [Bacteroides sp.]